jgi:dTDP-4-dehydrorhamnose reductase
MNILLLGANGQVGWELQRSLAPLANVSNSVLACARTPLPGTGTHALDITESDALVAIIRTHKPSLIVNAAAYTAVDKAQTEQAAAFAANATAPGVMAAEAKALGAMLVHYSTDYVFDGTKQGAYVETDAPNPQSAYGASKLAGEQAIVASGADALILRLSWVFGVHGNNFPKTMLRLARERDALKVVADQHGRPTPAELAADITVRMAAASHMRPKGAQIVHLAAAGPTTWHAFAQQAIEMAHTQNLPGLKVTAGQVEAITTAQYPTPATRPANSILDTTKLEQRLGNALPHWHGYLETLVVGEAARLKNS